MSTRNKVPGKPSWSYATGEGIYRLVGTGDDREYIEVLDWCPTVLRYIVTKDSRGKITTARYTIEVSGHQDTIYAEELRTGEGWDRFPQAVGHYDRQVKDTLAAVVGHQAARLPQTVAAPYWDADSLVLSERDLMPPGYGDRAGHDLAGVTAIAADNPRLALVLGLSYGAPYVEPLGRQSFWCHMTGAAREGKSTGLTLAASVWGRPWPKGTIIPWNTTQNGVTAALGDLAVLPAFLDDLHAAGFTPSQIRKLIFSTAEGNARLRSSRTGRRKDSPPWYGVLFSTGNDSILGMLPQAEVAARVVEIPAPLTDTAATSKLVKDWARANYGHFRAVPIVTMRAHVDQAEELLRGPIDGGTEETIMENLALGVAGAFVVGGKPLADAALYAAREILDVLKVELAETGVKPAEKLLEAVRQYLASRPGAFPTRDAYAAALAHTDRPAPQVEGWWEPPIAYVLTSKMSGIAGAYGIGDPRVGLRELRKAKILLAQANANQLRKQIRAAGRRVDTYAFRLDDSPTPTGKTETTSDTSATSVSPDQTLWEPSLVTSDASDRPLIPAARGADDPDAQPVTPQVNGMSPDGPERPRTAPEPVSVDTPDRIAHGARSGQTGEPGDTGPVSRKPLRALSSSSVEEDAEEWARWCEIIRCEDAWPTATPEQCLSGLKTFQRALGGLRHLGTSAVAGQLLFHKLQAQHGSIPVLEEGGLAGLEDMTVARTFNGVDTNVDVERYPWVLALDVNAQFLAVTGSVELGTGWAEEVQVPRFTDPRAAKQYYSKPGYVQVTSDTRIGPAHVIPEGSWIAHPTAAYLHGRGCLQVAPQGYVWREHRRWLSAWGDVARRARTGLMENQGDLAADMALHALKLMYASFLGGFLRSESYNRGRTLRPDWHDQLVSLARVNAVRSLDNCTPSPFATHLDAAFFLLEDNQAVQGLQINTQAGKWKVARFGPTTGPATITRGGKEFQTTLAEQVAAGSVGGVNDVVADLDRRRRGIAVA